MPESATLAQVWAAACRRRWKKNLLFRKDMGFWQGRTGQECYLQTARLALGLERLGFGQGMPLVIVGNNAPQWLFAQFAAVALGGVYAGAYPDSLAPEIGHILERSKARFVVAEDQEQVDKLLSLAGDHPLRHIIYWEPRGLKHYHSPLLRSFSQVLDLGQEAGQASPERFEEAVQALDPVAPCAVYLSSGTLNLPKLALFNHLTLLDYTRTIDRLCPARPQDRHFSYGPLASIGDMVINCLPALLAGAPIFFPESRDTVQEDLREVGVSRIISLPRAYELQVSEIKARMARSGPIRRLIYRRFMALGLNLAEQRMEGRKPGLFSRLARAVGRLILYRSLLDWLGLARARVALSSGGALGREFFLFFQALGLNLVNVYGSTETGTVAAHNPGEPDPDSVGRPLPGVELKISPQGEILVKSPTRMLGYYHDPAATREAFDPDGFLRTGDAGRLDGQGRLIYLDRLDDLMRLESGYAFSPQFIESRLKFSPYIRDAVILGHGRPHIAALIGLDFAHVSDWAESRLIPYTTFMDLAQKDEVIHLVAQEVGEVNQELEPEARIHGFAVLPKQLDPDDLELTRTSKLRRGFVGGLFSDLDQAVFAGRKEARVSIRVTYPDGRKGSHQARVRIVALDGAGPEALPSPKEESLGLSA